MSSNNGQPLLEAHNLGKAYRIYKAPRDRLKELLLGWTGRRYGREHWALRHFNFSLHAGEIVGVIGRNGSGKTTLLRLLAGILKPTEGRIVARGRVRSLIELLSGMNPDFDGWENIRLKGTLLGLSPQEIQERMGDIADFAELGDFIHQPLRTYSTGMQLRLAFSVVIHAPMDVFLVDEIISVGDLFFRQKSLQHILHLREQGVGIVLVTHNLNYVEEICNRALLLEQGRVLMEGNPADVVREFYLLERRRRSLITAANTALSKRDVKDPGRRSNAPREHAKRGEESTFWPEEDTFFPAPEIQEAEGARLLRFSILGEDLLPKQSFVQGEKINIFLEYELERTFAGVIVPGLTLRNETGLPLYGYSGLIKGTVLPPALPAGSRIRIHFIAPLNLTWGPFTVEATLAELPIEVYEQRHQRPYTEVLQHMQRFCFARLNTGLSIHPPLTGMPTHFGLCNLDGHMRIWSVSREQTQSSSWVSSPMPRSTR